MKLKALYALVVAAGLCSLPALAAEATATGAGATVEVAEQETVKLSVVVCKGGG